MSSTRGITRARSLMHVYGHVEAAKTAARSGQIEDRYSMLHDWLLRAGGEASADALASTVEVKLTG